MELYMQGFFWFYKHHPGHSQYTERLALKRHNRGVALEIQVAN